MKQRIKDPVRQGPSVEDDLGFQEHAGLQCRLPAVRIDIVAIERGDRLVHRLLGNDRSGRIRFGQHSVRQLDDMAGVGAEILVRKSVILEPHFLPTWTKPAARVGISSSACNVVPSGTISICSVCG